jgi:high-affinity iron transporter
MSSQVMATFVIVFREMLEAGLIVGIILTVLNKLCAMRYAPHVWASVGAAGVVSLAAGWALSVAAQASRGQWEAALEGIISLAACGVLTYMVFWMDRQGKRIRPAIEEHMEGAVTRSELAAIVMLPFLAVLREGAETVLFLKAVSLQNSGSVSLLGGLSGAGLAVAVTAAIFVWGKRVPLQALFRGTGMLIFLIAAGMLAYGIHEIQELGWLPFFSQEVWNINHLLNEKQGIGSFLKALFGYNGNPSGLEVAAYLAYLLGVSVALRGWQRPSSPGGRGTPVVQVPESAVAG